MRRTARLARVSRLSVSYDYVVTYFFVLFCFYSLVQPKIVTMACVTVLYVNGHVSLMSIFFKLKLQWYIQNRGGAL